MQGSAQEKPVVLETSPPPAAASRTLLKAVGEAGLTYAKATDETVGASRPVQLSFGDGGWGSLNASFKYKGKDFQRPSTIILSTFLAAKDRTYVDDRRFVLVVDGVKIVDGSAELTDGRTNGKEVYSSLKAPLPLADFKKLVAGQKIAIQIGPSKWEIPVDKLSGFRDLLALIEAGL